MKGTPPVRFAEVSLAGSVKPAAWELLTAAAQRVGMLQRCVSCRRPERLTIVAWRDGWYAVLVPESGGSRFVVFDPWGRAQLHRERTAERLETPGWMPIQVQLDAEGLCPRCRYCRQHNLPLGTTPRGATQDQTRRSPR